jgi:signal transduction histidine kinase
MATSLIGVVALATVGLYLQQRLAQEEAIGLSRETSAIVARAVVGPLVRDDLLAGDSRSLALLDTAVRERVLDDEIVRVKVWRADGRILYSDQTELIGQRYALGPDDLAALRSGDVEREVSDLERRENRFERSFGKLFEIYLGVDTPSGERVLVETYHRFEGVSAGRRRLLLLFAPTLIGAILLLWALQGPLAWSMARKLQRGQEEQERLLLRAVEASDVERRRIAADLHDGVVQRLAGTAYTLAAAGERLMSGSEAETRRFLDESVVNVRRAMQELRTLIVEIHPAILASEGLAAALNDLVAPLATRDIAATVNVADGLDAHPDVEKLLFRAAQEAVRNVIAHSRARAVSIDIVAQDGIIRLVVDDDGCGIDPAGRAARAERGHVGLDLLGELAAEQGGSLRLGSSPSGGARLILEVPER